jgi:peroxiredoxin
MAAKIPYLWVNHVLLNGSAVLILGASLLLVASFVVRRLKKSALRWVSLASFFLGLALGLANYGFIFYVQLPAYSRVINAAVDDRREASSLVKLGDPAPGFRVKTLDAAEFALDRQRGKTVLLVFFATWCGPCNLELPHIEEIWQANRSRPDFALLAISREETDEKLAAFKAEHGYTLPIASDPKREVYSRYAKELIPRLYLIGPDGTIRYTSTGFNEERLPELLEQVASR